MKKSKLEIKPFKWPRRSTKKDKFFSVEQLKRDALERISAWKMYRHCFKNNPKKVNRFNKKIKQEEFLIQVLENHLL